MLSELRTWYAKNSEVKLVTGTLISLMRNMKRKLNVDEEAMQAADFEMCRELLSAEIVANSCLAEEFELFHRKVIHRMNDNDPPGKKGQVLANIIKMINKQPDLT